MKYNDKMKEWEHDDDCLHIYPLATGSGFWHCSCGYDAHDALREETAALRIQMSELLNLIYEGDPQAIADAVGHVEGV